mmetsp:Transcript_101963/g.283756  ORF Transcript_101963/g.283756 Transcript_101963/m.283756 type:complete len:454 (+) Transcript_101963:92-1453(+)
MFEGIAGSMRSWICRAVVLRSSLLAIIALAFWLQGVGPMLQSDQSSTELLNTRKHRRLFLVQQTDTPLAGTENTYKTVYQSVFCSDVSSLLFDNVATDDKNGFRIQAECEEKCNQDSQCHFMLWGWIRSGYYRCATFKTCGSQTPFREGEPHVFQKMRSQDQKQVDREPHAMWIGGAYKRGNDPMTLEFCSLTDDCDVFGEVAPLPPDTGALSACASKGGRWCSVHPPLNDLYTPVDGGVGRACRRTSREDNADDYYHVKKLSPEAGFDECQGLCLAHKGCTGIEHIAFAKEHRCEIWQTRIMATLPHPTATCIRHVNWLQAPNCCLKGSCGACEKLGPLGVHSRDSCVEAHGQWCDPACPWQGIFGPVDGGVDRSCRGAEPWDNDPSYFETLTLGIKDNLNTCKQRCLEKPDCKGIDYTELAKGPRCNLWTRSAGIGASQRVAGSLCLRWLD